MAEAPSGAPQTETRQYGLRFLGAVASFEALQIGDRRHFIAPSVITEWPPPTGHLVAILWNEGPQRLLVWYRRPDSDIGA